MDRHDWTIKDEVIALFLYKFGEEDLIFDIPGIASKLGMSKDSLKAKIENFKFLDTGKGLSNFSKNSKQVYEDFKNAPKNIYLAVVKTFLSPQKVK